VSIADVQGRTVTIDQALLSKGLVRAQSVSARQ
jgi:hypothetical protein